MNDEQSVIDSLEALAAFIVSVENGGLGLQGVAGIGMATNNADGRPFVAVFDDNNKLLMGRWVTQDVYENGKEIVRNGVQPKH